LRAMPLSNPDHESRRLPTAISGQTVELIIGLRHELSSVV
jgi:hypothetical protein